MDDNRQELPNAAGTKLSREQKAGFVFVIVCGLTALIFGGQYLWTHLASPFVISYTGPRFVTGSEAEQAQLAEQKQLDSDTDGINDYDEMYVYKSSPYLSDSDSDGVPDGTEITGGQDPNCAQGAECAVANDETITLDENLQELDAQAEALAKEQAALQQALSDLYGMPISEIRQLLVQSGADPKQVEALSDDQVMQMYTGVLQQLESEQQISGLSDSIAQPIAP
jgi:hypothetical protein